MPAVSPTLFVARFPNRQVDCIHTSQRILSRNEQVRSAAEALRGVVSGRLLIRDAQGDVKSLQGSPPKAARERGGQKSSMPPFFRPRIVWVSDQPIIGSAYQRLKKLYI
jgi:hypothetical protein